MKVILTLVVFAMAFNLSAKNKNWKCINEDGSLAFTLEAKHVYDFNEGIAPVKIQKVVDNKWVSFIGFVNTKGQMVVPAIYDKFKGRGFVNGRAWVKKKDANYWTLIDNTGKEIPTNNYDNVGYIFENNFDLIAVYKNDKLGFINLDGKEIIPCQYLGDTFFSGGLSCVTPYEGEKGYGFINPKGEIVIPFQFKQAGTSSFSYGNGMCRATVGGTTVLIDKTGKTVFKTSKGNIQGISNNWIRVFTKSDRSGWGFLDFENNWKIEPTYNDIEHFNKEGYALAQKGELWGIIDTNNNVKIPFKYASLYFDPENDGYILGALPTEEPQSMMNTPKDYFRVDFTPIDLNGKQYIYSADGSKLMAYKSSNGMHGYLDRDFNIVIKARYSKVRGFHNGVAWVLD